MSGLDRIIEDVEGRLAATEKKLEQTAKRLIDLMQALHTFRYLRESDRDFAIPGIDQTYYGGA